MDGRRLAVIGWSVFVFLLLLATANAQEIKLKNASSWQVQGRAQIQNLFNSDIEGDAGRTNNGFRIRRGRFQVVGLLTEFVEAKFQIEARDNSPRLKDAEGTMKFANGLYLRFGQFKVPVWREELRSSGKLMLVERSVVAGFLADFNLSVRHIGMELGRRSNEGVDFAINLSNGAGEGVREDAGRSKTNFVNNGKLITGRINIPVGSVLQVAVSGVLNRVGNKIGSSDNTGSIRAIAPDFGLYFDAGERGNVEIEGGLVFGSVDKEFAGGNDDMSFNLLEVTGRFTKKLAQASEGFAGMDGFELAAGFSQIDYLETVFTVVRFGPAFYFGKQTRLQVNGEIENPEEGDNVFKVRSQITFNF